MPTVSLWAWAATGADIAAAIAAMASILFRMVNSLARDAGRLAPARNPTQCLAHGIVPQKRRHTRGHFGHFLRAREPVEVTGVSYRGTGQTRKMQASIRFPAKLHSGEISMNITAAHIPAIVALIAGILILIMPRLLNLVVAIYLICIGLIGLGVLKWLHM
jgi:hypothetical protein